MFKDLPDCDVWGGPDDEELRHDSPEDYVLELLDDTEPGGWPRNIEVCGYRRPKVHLKWPAHRILERMLEWYDEDFGDPEEPTCPTAAMQQAAQNFVQAFEAEYRPWRCDRVCTTQIDVVTFVREYDGTRLTDPEVLAAIERIEAAQNPPAGREGNDGLGR